MESIIFIIIIVVVFFVTWAWISSIEEQQKTAENRWEPEQKSIKNRLDNLEHSLQENNDKMTQLQSALNNFRTALAASEAKLKKAVLVDKNDYCIMMGGGGMECFDAICYHFTGHNVQRLPDRKGKSTAPPRNIKFEFSLWPPLQKKQGEPYEQRNIKIHGLSYTVTSANFLELQPGTLVNWIFYFLSSPNDLLFLTNPMQKSDNQARQNFIGEIQEYADMELVRAIYVFSMLDDVSAEQIQGYFNITRPDTGEVIPCHVYVNTWPPYEKMLARIEAVLTH